MARRSKNRPVHAAGWEIGTATVERCDIAEGEYWCGVAEVINLITDVVEHVAWTYLFVDDETGVILKHPIGATEIEAVVDTLEFEFNQAVSLALVEFYQGTRQ